MVTPLRPFVVQDPSLFSRLPGHKRVSISVSKEMEFLGMPGCPAVAGFPCEAEGPGAEQFSTLAFLTFSDGQEVTFLPLSSRKMVNGIRLLKGARKVIILASGKPSQLACSHRAEMHDF